MNNDWVDLHSVIEEAVSNHLRGKKVLDMDSALSTRKINHVTFNPNDIEIIDGVIVTSYIRIHYDGGYDDDCDSSFVKGYHFDKMRVIDDLVELRGHCDPNDMAMAEKLELKSDLSSFITTRLEQHGGSWTGDVKVHEDSW